VIRRTWACLNRHCIHEFTTEGNYPPCPQCGGIRVKWLPQPFAIKSEATRKVDATVAEVSKTLGEKNYRSPVRGESMAPKVAAAPPRGTMKVSPQPGWSLDVPTDRAGYPVSFCGPTGVSSRLSTQVGDRVSKVRASGPGPTPRVVHTHKG